MCAEAGEVIMYAIPGKRSPVIDMEECRYMRRHRHGFHDAGEKRHLLKPLQGIVNGWNNLRERNMHDPHESLAEQDLEGYPLVHPPLRIVMMNVRQRLAGANGLLVNDMVEMKAVDTGVDAEDSFEFLVTQYTGW